MHNGKTYLQKRALWWSQGDFPLAARPARVARFESPALNAKKENHPKGWSLFMMELRGFEPVTSTMRM